MAELDDLYEQVPSANCKGLCQEACGPLPMSVEEGRRLRRNGTPIPHDDIATAQFTLTGKYSCPALDAEGRCSVYELRPMICRLYGVVENMKCQHGCVPDGGFMSMQRASELVKAATAAGGGLR